MPQLLELLAEDPHEAWHGWITTLVSGLARNPAQAGGALDTFYRDVADAPRVELIPEAIMRMVDALNGDEPD